MKVSAIHFETTGSNPHMHSIIEIACVNNLRGTFQCTIERDQQLWSTSRLQKMVDSGYLNRPKPPLVRQSEVWDTLLPFMGNFVLVGGQNPDFLLRLTGAFIGNIKYIDICTLALRKTDVEVPTLPETFRRFNVPDFTTAPSLTMADAILSAFFNWRNSIGQ